MTPVDDSQYTRTPASQPEIREDFGTASRSAVLAAGGSLPLYADFETERAVLASILAEPETFHTILPLLGVEAASELKRTKDGGKGKQVEISAFRHEANIFFRDPKHALIYEALREVNARGGDVDLLTVTDHLQKTERLAGIGGMDYLIALQSSITSTANLEGWCRILRDCAMLREIIRTCSDALDICKKPGQDVREMLNTIEGNLFSVRNNFTKSEIVPFRSLLYNTVTYFADVFQNKVPTGIMTEYPDLDCLTGGLRRQEMFVLAARPSIGKTALALNIVRNIMMKAIPDKPRYKVAFFSLEMSAEQVTQRLLCAEARVPLSSIMSRKIQNSDFSRLMSAADALGKADLTIDETGGLSVFELRAKARKLKETSGLDLIVIDYLTLMRAEVKASDGRQVEVAAISGGLKKIAKDLNVPVLVLAQLNRDVEKGQGGKNSRPKLSHLRESGAIEQDADVVCFLHRERDESKESDNSANQDGVKAELIVEKNRNGATGITELRFFPQLMEFRAVDHKYERSDASV